MPNKPLVPWQQNLLDLVHARDTVICYGNIRDRYVFHCPSGPIVLPSFAALLTHLLTPDHGPIYLYNRLERLRTADVQADAFVETPAPNQITGLATNMASVEQDLAALMEYLGTPLPVVQEGERTPRYLVVGMADTLLCESGSRDTETLSLLMLGRRMVECITAGRKLILVYLAQKNVPSDLYINAPQVGMLEIPLPEPEERALIAQAKGLSEQLVTTYANLTDGLSAAETDGILTQAPSYLNVNRIQELEHADQVERAIRRYKFGQRPDYYEHLSLKRLQHAEAFFTQGSVRDDQGQEIDRIPGVMGQPDAIRAVVRMLWRAKAGVMRLLRDPGSLPPRGVLFFCGSSGTGKTMLAKRIARFLFDSEESFFRFDMSEYMHDHAVSKLIGAPPGYVGSERGGMLTNAVRAKPFSVILFDEMEKAHPRVLDIFLQILSDGRLTDSHGQTAFFSEAIIVFTSNVGRRSKRISPVGSSGGGQECQEEARYKHLLQSEEGDWSQLHNHFNSCVRDYFEREISRPELLNRLGNNIIPFRDMDSRDIVKELFSNYLKKIERSFKQLYRRRDLTLTISEEVLTYLTNKHEKDVQQFGGRAVVNALEDEMLTELAKRLLAHASATQRSFVVTVRSDRLHVD